MSEVQAVKKDPKMYWGDGGKEKRRVRIPAPGVVVNGVTHIGQVDMTYGQYANAMSMLSARIEHELTQRLGKKDAEIVIGLGAGSSSELF